MACRLVVPALLATSILAAAEDRFVLKGQVAPPSRSLVALFGATTPYSARALTDLKGQFKFSKLAPGTYILAFYVFRQGEMRRTVEIGPGTANARREVAYNIRLDSRLMDRDAAKRAHLVSIKELSVSDKARKLYYDAQKRLAKKDAEGAIQRFREAVAMSPTFGAAWNALGTVEYRLEHHAKAEEAFRQAYKINPESRVAQLNLGSVLLAQDRPREALEFNRKAVTAHPEDALANAQTGVNLLLLGQTAECKRLLETAKRLDPAHYSNPQLVLASIYMREGNRAAAARELQEHLRLHPDVPDRAKILETLKQLQ